MQNAQKMQKGEKRGKFHANSNFGTSLGWSLFCWKRLRNIVISLRKKIYYAEFFIMQHNGSCRLGPNGSAPPLPPPPEVAVRSKCSCVFIPGGGVRVSWPFLLQKKIAKKTFKKNTTMTRKRQVWCKWCKLAHRTVDFQLYKWCNSQKGKLVPKNDGCNVKLRGFWSNPLGLPCAITLCNHPVKIGWPKYAKKNSMCAHSPKI